MDEKKDARKRETADHEKKQKTICAKKQRKEKKKP
jgi:hypothetical protein